MIEATEVLFVPPLSPGAGERRAVGDRATVENTPALAVLYHFRQARGRVFEPAGSTPRARRLARGLGMKKNPHRRNTKYSTPTRMRPTSRAPAPAQSSRMSSRLPEPPPVRYAPSALP